MWDGREKPEEPLSFREVTRERPIPGKLLYKYLADLDREIDLPTGPKFIELLADIDVGPADAEQILRLAVDKIKDYAASRNPSWQAFWAKLAYATLTEGSLASASAEMPKSILTQLAPQYAALSQSVGRTMRTGIRSPDSHLVAALASLAGTEVTLRLAATTEAGEAPEVTEVLAVPERAHGRVEFSEELLDRVNPEFLRHVIGDKEKALPAGTEMGIKLCQGCGGTSLCVNVLRAGNSEPQHFQRPIADDSKPGDFYRAVDEALRTELERDFTTAPRHPIDRLP